VFDMDTALVPHKCLLALPQASDPSGFGSIILSNTYSTRLRTICHALLNLSNGFGRVETLGTRPGAVEDGMASVKRHAVL